MCDWCVTYVEQMQATIASLRRAWRTEFAGAFGFGAGGLAGEEDGRGMIAYKFLRSGRVGPFSAFPWPEPGVWVHAARDLAACRRGIHACRPSDLPWWLADELWEVELDGQVQADEHKIIAPAGRLRSRIEAWTPACAQEYADACAWRAQERAVEALTRAGHRHEARQLASLRDARRRAGRGAAARRRHTRDTDQPHDRRRRRRPRSDRRAADERVHRRPRGDATGRGGRLRGRASVAVALARRAARPAHRSTPGDLNRNGARDEQRLRRDRARRRGGGRTLRRRARRRRARRRDRRARARGRRVLLLRLHPVQDAVASRRGDRRCARRARRSPSGRTVRSTPRPPWTGGTTWCPTTTTALRSSGWRTPGSS